MNKKFKVYLDTSVISALFDNRNPQRQLLTKTFFDKIGNFDVYISELVLAEIYNTKNAHLKKLLTEKAYSFEILPVNIKSSNLSDIYLHNNVVPAGYAEDALHIAIASINRIDYLLSWNFEHLVKMKTREIVNKVNFSRNYPRLQIITPAELL